MQRILEQLKISQLQLEQQHPDLIIEQIKELKSTNKIKQVKQIHSTSSSSHQLKSSKKRFLMYKCKICKTSGRKSQTLMCIKCKYYFHKVCVEEEKILQIEKNMGRQFVCEICSNNNERLSNTQTNTHHQPAKHKQPRTHKQLSGPQESHSSASPHLSSSFINISKLTSLYTLSLKSQQQRRLLYNFSKRYSYYFVNNNKISFPIDERVLFVYGGCNKNNNNGNNGGFMKIRRGLRPELKQVTGGNADQRGMSKQWYVQHMEQLLQIQIFFSNFYHDIISILPYLAMNISSEYHHFTIDTFRSETIFKYFLVIGLDQLFMFILELFLRMYLNDIIDRNKIENMKFIGGDVFFNILGVIKQGKQLKNK